jgi:hypothetical protein
VDADDVDHVETGELLDFKDAEPLHRLFRIGRPQTPTPDLSVVWEL